MEEKARVHEQFNVHGALIGLLLDYYNLMMKEGIGTYTAKALLRKQCLEVIDKLPENPVQPLLALQARRAS